MPKRRPRFPAMPAEPFIAWAKQLAARIRRDAAAQMSATPEQQKLQNDREEIFLLWLEIENKSEQVLLSYWAMVQRIIERTKAFCEHSDDSPAWQLATADIIDFISGYIVEAADGTESIPLQPTSATLTAREARVHLETLRRFSISKIEEETTLFQAEPPEDQTEPERAADEADLKKHVDAVLAKMGLDHDATKPCSWNGFTQNHVTEFMLRSAKFAEKISATKRGRSNLYNVASVVRKWPSYFKA